LLGEEEKEERSLPLVMNLSKTHNISILIKKEEIDNIFKNGKKVFTKYGSVFFYLKEESSKRKVAIFVRKKIGKASYRNYIKRIIRYFIRKNLTLFANYNRVIFLFGYYNKKLQYKDLESGFKKSLLKEQKNNG
jgi:ribonuclease P protein component